MKFFIILAMMTLASWDGVCKSFPKYAVASPHAHAADSKITQVIGLLTEREDKLQVYRLWIDSLKLKVAQADQDRMAGKLSNDHYDTYLDDIAEKIEYVADAVGALGYGKLAREWKKLGQKYEKIMVRPEASASRI